MCHNIKENLFHLNKIKRNGASDAYHTLAFVSMYKSFHEYDDWLRKKVEKNKADDFRNENEQESSVRLYLEGFTLVLHSNSFDTTFFLSHMESYGHGQYKSFTQTAICKKGFH